MREVRKKFLFENKIHESYYEFFSYDMIIGIEKLIREIEEKGSYLPEKEKIFKVFRSNLIEAKIVLLGMDPYPQSGVATGLAFEVESSSWADKGVNTSLKNIAKLIYKTYTGQVPNLELLRNEIESGKFKILPPNKIFKSWVDQGVILLNTALTVREGEPGSHSILWKDFTKRLLLFIQKENSELVFLLWGRKAQYYKKYIENSKIISHNHPAICGNLKNPKDFMNGKSFEETMGIINWKGVQR